jgi:hypothetical protein
MLRASQLDHQMLVSKYKSLKIEHDLVASRRSGKSTKRPERGSLSGESKEISLAGGRFSVVGELWVGTALLDIPYPREVDPLNAARYASSNAENLGVIAELYQDLPPHLQEALASENRHATFKKIVCPITHICLALSPNRFA